MWTPDPSIIVTAEQKQNEANAAQRRIDFPTLEPDQFWFIVRKAGYEYDLKGWLENLKTQDPDLWAFASAKLEFAKHFERDHPLVEIFRQELGITEVELDLLWRHALS